MMFTVSKGADYMHCYDQQLSLFAKLLYNMTVFLIISGQNAYIVFTEKSQATIQMLVYIYTQT
jgi:hypothetical protein